MKRITNNDLCYLLQGVAVLFLFYNPEPTGIDVSKKPASITVIKEENTAPVTDAFLINNNHFFFTENKILINKFSEIDN